jgi:hypothetical protein
LARHRISIEDPYPSFRGRKLNQPNFAKDSRRNHTLLIGNKEREFQTCY